ncbi:LCP family protein [Gordonia bronchialis]|uniref:LCP family protein n=1 Tax=Gordonia bronchialis TaxID=2054 RepID=UPI001CBB722A|nr:LCP family protein [Gordonia bronchialis]
MDLPPDGTRGRPRPHRDAPPEPRRRRPAPGGARTGQPRGAGTDHPERGPRRADATEPERRTQPRRAPRDPSDRAREQQTPRRRPARGTAPQGGAAPRDAAPRTEQRDPERRPRRADPADPSRPRRPAKPTRTDAEKRRTSGEIHTRTRPAAEGSRTGPPPTRRRRKPSAPDAVRADGAPAPDTNDAPVDGPPPGGGTTGRGGRGGRSAWGRGLVALVSVAVLMCTGYAWNSLNSLQNKINQISGLGLGGAEDGAVDILLVGTDSRTDAKGNPLSADEQRMLRAGDEVATNTDTILLIRIPNDGSSATAISIPRDSYVQVPGIGMSKINAAYGATREGVRAREVSAGTSEKKAEADGTFAGRKALIDTVAGLTGVHVDHYAEVGLLGFVLLTKAVGGVDVCLKAASVDPVTGARFRAGRQTLSGPRALSFVRQRHGLPRGDLDRITRQQAYMASLTQKILSANTLTDPGKLSDLEEAVSRSVVIDDDWDVVSFAEQLKDLSGGRVKFATIPVVTEQGWSDDGQQSVVRVDPAAVAKFTDGLLNPDRTNAQRSDYTVDVVNAGTVDGLASNVANILTNKGFQEGSTSTQPADTRDSVVLAHDDNDGARLLARDLGGARVQVDPSLDEHRLKVVLTNTYSGPGSISDTGSQEDNRPASERVGNNRPPITAGTDGPTCVN